MLEMDKKCNALSNTGFVTKRMSGSGKKRCWPLYVSWSVWIWVWFGTEFELFHCFLLKVESQWRWLSFETWTKIFVLSYNSQPANQKRFASGRRIAHNIKKSRSFSVLTNQSNRICHMTQKQWNVSDFRSTFSSFRWEVALFQNYCSAKIRGKIK